MAMIGIASDDLEYAINSPPKSKSIGIKFIAVQFPNNKGVCAIIITVYEDGSYTLQFHGDIFNERYSLEYERRLKNEVNEIIKTFKHNSEKDITPDAVQKFILHKLKKLFEKDEFEDWYVSPYEV